MVVRCCPKCGASNYIDANPILGYFAQEEFECKECGYRGIFVDVDDPKQFRKELFKAKK